MSKFFYPIIMFTPEQIEALRLALRLTRTELAAKIGVSESAVCRWVKGERHPSYKRMRRLNELAEEGGFDPRENLVTAK